MTNLNDFPAIDGRVITEGHANLCRTHGHARHLIDGRPSTGCPRCGETLISIGHNGLIMVMPMVEMIGYADITGPWDMEGYVANLRGRNLYAVADRMGLPVMTGDRVADIRDAIRDFYVRAVAPANPTSLTDFYADQPDRTTVVYVDRKPVRFIEGHNVATEKATIAEMRADGNRFCERVVFGNGRSALVFSSRPYGQE